MDQTIEWINTKTNLGHSACIMTQSGKHARKFMREVNVGNVGVNLGVAQPYSFFPLGSRRAAFLGNAKSRLASVVCIKQIPHPGWGTQENLAGGFWIITINDLNILDPEVQTLLESHPMVDADGLPTVGRRRLYIRLASMTTSARNALESTGTYVVTTARLPAFRLAITAR